MYVTGEPVGRGSGVRSLWGGRPVMAGRGRLLSACLVQGALQRLDVAGTGVAGAAYRVDVGALRDEGLAGQLGDGVAVDLVALRAVVRSLEHGDLGDLHAGQG